MQLKHRLVALAAAATIATGVVAVPVGKASYRGRKADRGHRLQVRVKALRQGYRGTVAVSAPVRVRR
jgi:hypothetical protein